jgi:CHAT domain-containing protein/tetratricopeptide (TPR) repeat protein
MKYFISILSLLLSTYTWGQELKQIDEIDSLILSGEFIKAKEKIALLKKENQTTALQFEIDLLIEQQENILLKNTLSTILPGTIEESKLQTYWAVYYLLTDLQEQNLGAIEKAKSIFIKQNNSNNLSFIQFLKISALSYFNAGQTAEAEENISQAISLYKDFKKQSLLLNASLLNDLGLIKSVSNVNEALIAYEEALVIYKKTLPNNHPKIGINLMNTAILLRNDESFGEAINNLEEAIGLFKKDEVKYSIRIGFALFQLGITYEKMKKLPEAKSYYQQALTYYTKNNATPTANVIEVYNNLGLIEKNNNSFKTAKESFDKALQVNLVNASTNLSYYKNSYYAIYAHSFHAQNLEQQHALKTLKFKDIVNALSHIHRADSLIDLVRKSTIKESDKIKLSEIANEVYADGVRIAFYASEIASKHKKKFQALAFYYAEKSRAATLQEVIQQAKAKTFAGLPENILKAEQNLKSTLANLSLQLANSAQSESVQKEYFEVKKQLDLLENEIKQNYPDYFKLKVNNEIPSVSTIQNKLNENEVLITYFIDDSKNNNTPSIYIFKCNKHKLIVSKRTLPDNYNKIITGFKNGLYFSEPVITHQTSSVLYKLLFPKGLPKQENLIIIPNARFSIIPFEALIVKGKQDEVEYLLERKSVRYEIASSLMLDNKVNYQPNNQNLFCAPETFSTYYNLSDLPGSKTEIINIENTFKKENLTYTSLTSTQATEVNFKSALSSTANFNIVHLATHGEVNEEFPDKSRIYLLPASNEDGPIYNGELYNLKIPANLITLSACETGLGKMRKGEGLIGLSRALRFAGAQQIIVSFWKVADASTALLMQYFYENAIDKKLPFPEALQKAKITLMKDGYDDPYYWAPFVLLGY